MFLDHLPKTTSLAHIGKHCALVLIIRLPSIAIQEDISGMHPGAPGRKLREPRLYWPRSLGLKTGANFSFLLGVRSRCLWLSGETELKSYNCTFSRARSAIQPTHILAQEESEQGLPLAGTNLTTPLTTVQFSGACSSLSAHSPGTPVSGVNWSHQSGIYW